MPDDIDDNGPLETFPGGPSCDTYYQCVCVSIREIVGPKPKRGFEGLYVSEKVYCFMVANSYY